MNEPIGKQAMELAEQLHQPHKAGTRKQSNVDAEKVTERLWSRMIDLYGRQWEASYGLVGESAFVTWMEALSSMTVKQIKTGLDAVIEEGSEFPPNLIKFLRLCRTVSDPSHQDADLAALPPPNVHRRPEVITAKDKHFREVRKLLHEESK